MIFICLALVAVLCFQLGIFYENTFTVKPLQKHLKWGRELMIEAQGFLCDYQKLLDEQDKEATASLMETLRNQKTPKKKK